MSYRRVSLPPRPALPVPVPPPGIEAPPAIRLATPPPWFLAGLAFVGGAALGFAAAEFLLWAGSSVEQRGIRASARRHRTAGHYVEADHIGWPRRPSVMGGRRPDVFVRRANGTCLIEEHETTRTVGRRHSRDQDRDLRRAARRAGCGYRQIVHQV